MYILAIEGQMAEIFQVFSLILYATLGTSTSVRSNIYFHSLDI